MMHGDLEREVEEHLARDEHGEDLRGGPAASAQPGQRATEKDANGEQHCRVGQLTAADDVAEGRKLGGDKRKHAGAQQPPTSTRQFPHGRYDTAPTVTQT